PGARLTATAGRDHAAFIEQSRQEATRRRRIEPSVPRIVAGGASGEHQRRVRTNEAATLPAFVGSQVRERVWMNPAHLTSEG
ncbi:MAG: hypothetical protein RL199_1795, partial [Pseudomonadota bacterium]